MHNTELSLVCKVLGQSSTQLDAIRPTWISSNKHGLYSKQLLASLPEYLSAASAQHLGVLTGTTTLTHTPTAQECPLHLKLTDGEFTARSGETQEIGVAFQTNPSETRITTILSQSAACQNLPGVKQLCSCTLRSLPEVHAMVNTPSARGAATANKNLRTHRNMVKIKFCIILGEKEICTLPWKPRRGMRDEFLQVNSQSCYRLVSYGQAFFSSRSHFLPFHIN